MSKVVEKDQEEQQLNEDEQIVDPSKDDTTSDPSSYEVEGTSNQGESQEEEPGLEIPEKFKGATLEDSFKKAIDAYRNAEQELGRKGNEVGELRKLTDELLQLEIQQKKNTQHSQGTDNKTSDGHNKPKVSDDDWFESPKTATERYLQESPYAQKVQELEGKIKEQEKEKAHTAFEERHPDWQDLAKEGTFKEFATSSNHRYNLALSADQGDYDSANELFDLYRMYRKANGQGEEGDTQQEQQTRNREQLNEERKKASVESSASTPKTKKVYRRADLVRLRMNDPERYDAMQDEIMAAYAEGRVK